MAVAATRTCTCPGGLQSWQFDSTAQPFTHASQAGRAASKQAASNRHGQERIGIQAHECLLTFLNRPMLVGSA